MYFLYVKGRGYFNGTSQSSDSDWRKNTQTEYWRTERFKCKFKREINHVESSNSFSTKEEAQAKLDELRKDMKEWIDRGENADETRTLTPWKGNPYERVTHIHYPTVKDLLKYYDKIEIFHSEEYIAPKRTSKRASRKSMNIAKNRWDNTACDICGITLVIDEPYIKIPTKGYSEILICRNCMFSHADHLDTEYKSHPHHNEITVAWELERVSQGV